ncbi:unnamed protein product, partial [Hapterophycus canaliculatus]
RLIYKRVRTTEPDRSFEKRKEEGSSTFASPSSPLHHPPGGAIGSASGGRLDALLSSRGFNSPAYASPPPAAVLDYMEVRRVKARAVSGRNISNTISADPSACGGYEPAASNGVTPAAASRVTVGRAADFHVIDLQAVGRSEEDDMDTSGMDRDVAKRGGAIEAAGKASAAEKRAAAPVLTPVERQMDEAIFMAFKTGDLSNLRNILRTSSSLSPTSINYRRRLGDATTALMAAAFHGDLSTVRHLLSLGAKASLTDASGKSAALFAGMRGHRECFAEIQRVADEEEREERARSTRRHGSGGRGAGGGAAAAAADAVQDGGDFVYDVYYFEPPTPEASALPAACDQISDEGRTNATDDAAPVVRLSGIGPVDENAVGATLDVELEFEYDSDRSELGDGEEGEDPDSNSEGYYGNDYPEDEGDDEGGAGNTPYVYDDGSGSSYADGGSSSSDGGGGFDSDSDMEPYSRMVMDMKDEFSGDTGTVGDVLG